MAGVADLLDRAVDLPPGPALAAVLEQLAAAAVPNARRVDVLRARSRQLAHAQAELFAELVELSHTVALAELDTAEAVARAAEQQEWAAPEIAAALTWTTGAADRELALAPALVERLPLVQAALRRGNIDRSKARVFVEYLDPAHGDTTEEQAQALCERYLPPAPGLNTRQLSDRLHRAVQAIDPALRRRRYERAVQARGVALYLDPRTGTATLVGNGLPAHEAAAAAARLDRLVETAKRAGHPGTRPQISADLYLGMLDGSFHQLTEEQIIQRLLSGRRPDHQPATEQPATVREGIEIRLGLATAAGLDERPGEIAGLGPVGASVARAATAAQRRVRPGGSRSSTPGATCCWPVRCAAAPAPRSVHLRSAAAWSNCTSRSASCGATAPTRAPSPPSGKAYWPGSPPRGPAATPGWNGWPPARAPGSPAAHWPTTSASATVTASGPAAPARRAAPTSTTPGTTAAAAPRSTPTSARPAGATTATRTAAGRSPSPNLACSSGSARSGASTAPAANRSAPTSEPNPGPTPADDTDEATAELDRRLRRFEPRILEPDTTDPPRPPPPQRRPPGDGPPPF
jgi:hypothetical protein